ncbi:MAG: dethiobiotin synthetase [Clostridiales bacterium]|nr:dethiobiotin synthetase [Clostridiales bacterium]MDK2933799.1 dethiobiotin synthetase [Clostridiales bacterium]
MAKGIFIVGTDTDVGKTVVSGGLMYLLLTQGYNACYFKPVLSGASIEKGQLIPGDTRFVKWISGLEEETHHITPYSFQTPVSPHLAARIENRSIDINAIQEKFEYLKSQYDYIVAEGSGGFAVPLNDKGYMLYHLIQALNIGIIVVARAGLGTINHTILTVMAAQNMKIPVKGIMINGYDASALCDNDNIKTIKRVTGLPVLGVIPKLENVYVEKLQTGNLKDVFRKEIDISSIVELMTDL